MLALHVFSFTSAMLLNDAERSEASDCMPSAIVDRRIAAGILFCDRKKLIETHWRRFNVIPRAREAVRIAAALLNGRYMATRIGLRP